MKDTDTHTEPEHVRRKLAAAFRHEAENKRWKKNERATFANMAVSWERTLKKNRPK